MVQKLKALLLFRGIHEPTQSQVASVENVVGYLCEVTAGLPFVQSEVTWDGQVKHLNCEEPPEKYRNNISLGPVLKARPF